MRGLIAGLAMVAGLATAPTAMAALSVSGDFATRVISISETSKAADRVTVGAVLGDGFYILNSAGFNSVGPPCASVDAQTARCPVGDTAGLDFNLAEKNDRVTVDLPPDPTLEAIRYRYRLGAGNDRFTGGLVGEDIRSGIGNDRLAGGAGNDRLSGGKDADRLDGGDGDDSCNGGPDKDQANACESEKGIP